MKNYEYFYIDNYPMYRSKSHIHTQEFYPGGYYPEEFYPGGFYPEEFYLNGFYPEGFYPNGCYPEEIYSNGFQFLQEFPQEFNQEFPQEFPSFPEGFYQEFPQESSQEFPQEFPQEFSHGFYPQENLQIDPRHDMLLHKYATAAAEELHRWRQQQVVDALSSRRHQMAQTQQWNFQYSDATPPIDVNVIPVAAEVFTEPLQPNINQRRCWNFDICAGFNNNPNPAEESWCKKCYRMAIGSLKNKKYPRGTCDCCRTRSEWGYGNMVCNNVKPTCCRR